MNADNVNHPEHYNSGKYECINVMQDVFGTEDVKTFCKLNAFKYMWRTDKKNGTEDMKKAHWYLKKYFELENVVEIHPFKEPEERSGINELFKSCDLL